MKLQKPTPMPFSKYKSFQDRIALDMRDRTWPDQLIRKAPRWLSTDLRDGNQALIDPMTPDRKRKMFDLLVKLGFKEIEVGFPAASQVDFDFVREIIEQDAIPDDVRISVLTQAREDLIERTVESLVGAKKPTVHLYNATAPVFRKVVFGFDGEGFDQTREIATRGTQAVMKHAESLLGDADFGYQYSPEIFVDTEPEFALDIVGSVLDMWQPATDRETVVNLPATVERGTPNTYADQIEWFCRNMPYRDEVAVSLHPHNDRGTGVAAAEMGIMAGADRIEGCLFGNGERTGNLDLVTVALNLYTQGVDPELDFSDIDEVIHTVTECNQIGVHERHPYGGDLVFTSFSGSHQDAINKAFADREKRANEQGVPVDLMEWDMPYLPVDPKDLGRSYEAIIRVNSQSGKGGVTYLLKSEYGLDLPRRMQVEFSRAVQAHTEGGGEVSAEEIRRIFNHEYLPSDDPDNVWGRFQIVGLRTDSGTVDDSGSAERVEVDLIVDGQERTYEGHGKGPIDALVKILVENFDVDLRLQDYTEHAIGSGADTMAAAYVELAVEDRVVWGAGLHSNITKASLKAVVSAVNRAARDRDGER
ncbi:MAG: 2-isopropylmalate synthase [Brevibacterium aurantiacum]|uniref:2-isopropylmalate synthase n=1 Tax=Brevibacterium aurantiacum TaxID=273384 RepID=A0A2A3ZVT5_BREAU|nr:MULTISPECIES: 2-isopropylmalate synthase [Brevibacterium]MDN5594000.1 2-isopropylmalate synthase [Brevibacterium sp.]AZL09649.1 2-isopropylmalate synthase [Brevibacterium aurantiacum]AZL13284.1 2-isopropylmalate synthase [Brevibacterium aurantiacum]AZT93780.1 2-isopropylmalate synthase [Brevibacterium aurantiacum]MDN5608575.1 2-isopropylmalate synthase [Brevibacterium sp.]